MTSQPSQPLMPPMDKVDKGVGWATISLTLLSIPCAFLGVLQLSDATVGVGLIAVGCYFAILARMAQAGDHRKLMRHG